MRSQGSRAQSEWLWIHNRSNNSEDRPYEQTIINAEDAVRILLLIVLLVAGLVSKELVTGRLPFFIGLVYGSFLSLWARYEADWSLLKRLGNIPAGAAALAIGDLLWLSLVVLGTGGIASPFAGLLLIPILYSVVLFCRLKYAPLIMTGTVLLVYAGLALAANADLWRAGGLLVTVTALAWLSYAVCQVLERERQTNEVMMRDLSQGVILLDSSKRVVAANRQLQRLVDAPVDCVIGMDAQDLSDSERVGVIADVLQDVISTGGQEFSVRELSVSGHDVTDLLVTTVRLPGLMGERIGYVVVCEDVSAIKSAMRARAGGRSKMASELRSPAATLRVAASMLNLLADGIQQEEHDRVIEALDLDPRRLIWTIGDLINMSSLDDPALILDPSPTDVAALVNAVRRRVALGAERNDVHVRHEIRRDIGEVLLDVARIEDALNRLCENAVRFTPPGGEIFISAEMVGANLEISVQDEGPGIPPEHLPKIFDKFVQFDAGEGSDDRTRGLGLGLYFVRKIAALHGGQVRVTSRPGEGSTFTLILPVGDRVVTAQDTEVGGEIGQVVLAS